MEEENKDVCRIQMVNVEQLIDTLGILFSKGIDYIDVYQDKRMRILLFSSLQKIM